MNIYWYPLIKGSSAVIIFAYHFRGDALDGTEVKPLIGCSLAYKRNGEKRDNTNAVLFSDSIAFIMQGFENIELKRCGYPCPFIQGGIDGCIT
jgi:hypothetical protein